MSHLYFEHTNKSECKHILPTLTMVQIDNQDKEDHIEKLYTLQI